MPLAFRLLAALLALLVAVAAMPSCAGPSQSAPLLKIGLVAPFTGRERNLGYEALFAARLAIRQANADDALGGYRLELVAEDAARTPADAQRQFAKLAADPDVIGIVAYAITAPPTIPSGSPPTIVFGGPAPTPDGARSINADATAIATTVAAVLTGARSGAVLVVADNPLSARAFTAAGVAATRLPFTTPSQTRLGELTLPATAPPSLVYIDLPYDDAATVVRATRLAWPSVPLVLGPRTATFDLVRLAGDAAQGAYQVTFSRHPKDAPQLADFFAAYRALGGAESSFVAPLVYDATGALIDAIGRTAADGRRPTRDAAAAALDDVGSVTPLSGAIAWDAAGRRTRASVCVYRLGAAYPGDLVASPSCR